MSVATVRRLTPPAPHAGDVSQVRLSPDGHRLAFACTAGGWGGIYVAEVGADTADELVRCEGWTPAEIAWSPSGDGIAYRVAGKPAGFRESIGWCASTEAGERGRTPGMCFAWAAGKDTLYVGDPDELELCSIDTASGQATKLAHFGLHRSPDFWPQISPSPDGKFLVYTTRDDFEDTSRVWCIEWQNGQLESRLITWIPGAQIHLHPFWTPKGKTLGLYMVHAEQQKTGLIALRGVQGEGQILYQHDTIDGAITPAWSSQTDHIALFRGNGSGTPPALSLLNCQTGQTQLVPTSEPVAGDVRFATDGELVLDGGCAVYLLDPVAGDKAGGAQP
jgi:Tol biopolymer transport system component